MHVYTSSPFLSHPPVTSTVGLVLLCTVGNRFVLPEDMVRLNGIMGYSSFLRIPENGRRKFDGWNSWADN